MPKGVSLVCCAGLRLQLDLYRQKRGSMKGVWGLGSGSGSGSGVGGPAVEVEMEVVLECIYIVVLFFCFLGTTTT